MPLPIIADVYLKPIRSVAIMTTPGRRVEFHGGHARMIDHRDMPHVLRMPDAVIEPAIKYLDWLPMWLRACGEHKPPQAQVMLPEGYALGAAPDYELLRPQDAGEPAHDAEHPLDSFVQELAVSAGTSTRGRPRKPVVAAATGGAPDEIDWSSPGGGSES